MIKRLINYIQLLLLATTCLFGIVHATENYDALFTINVPSQEYAPTSVEQLQGLVKQAAAQGRKISVVGAGKSQGGQTIAPHSFAYRISLHNLNTLIHLNIKDKEAKVQAGMTWEQLQHHLAPWRLAVKTMQSYSDFSIGGSLSVNVHGQDFHMAPIIKTVKSFRLLLPNGEMVNVSRDENKELFGLVIGGYGLFGIIVDVTLQLTDDVIMESKTETLNSTALADYFNQHIKSNPMVEFYSARFSLGSSDLLQKVIVQTYYRTDRASTEDFTFENTLQKKITDKLMKSSLKLMKNFTSVKDWRFALEKALFGKSTRISRNNFMNNALAGLPNGDQYSHYILQEYFIPYPKLNVFIDFLRNLVKNYTINLLNVTARHVEADNESMLSFARQEACALVLYVNVNRKTKDYAKTVAWTRELIDCALSCNGTYYLPYQLIARPDQFEKAYPCFRQFLSLKRLYDPQELFVNQLYQCYA